MLTVPHRTASGRLESLWEFDPISKRIYLVVRGHGYTIPVCSERNPRAEAYAIRRIDDVTWRVAPSAYNNNAARMAKVAPFPQDRADAPELSEFVHLTQTPPNVCLELEDL